MSEWDGLGCHRWNLEYVTRFEMVYHPTKLLIPSVICSESTYAKTFADARSFSLKIFMVYITRRRDWLGLTQGQPSLGNGVFNVSRQARRAWGRINLEHSELLRPANARYLLH